MVKKMLAATLLLFIAGHAAPAKMFQSVPAEKAVLLQKGEAKMFCPVCGMHLGMFYKTSHAVTDAKGETKQYCSLHCLVEDHGHDAPKVQVVDITSLEFIDARKAHYVVGSRKPGTMTMQSKYAFASEADAKAFAGKNGGSVTDFEGAYTAAEGDFPKDKAMVDKKRAMMAKKGEKIFKMMCDPLKLTHTHSTAEAKAQILKTGACGTLKPKQLQAVGIYLSGAHHGPAGSIAVPEKAKCPVCGMFVAKYPKWAAEAVVGTKPYYFDGVKDMMKWLQHPGEYGIDPTAIASIFVTDYYSLEKVPAKAAHYVVGSNVYGPMGNELIPFKSLQSAETFAKEHEGKTIVSFDAITEEMVAALDR
jgi:nitrous oxide reductase accessory protein NosL